MSVENAVCSLRGGCAGDPWLGLARKTWASWESRALRPGFVSFLKQELVALRANPVFCAQCKAEFSKPGGLRDWIAALEEALAMLPPERMSVAAALWVSAFHAHVTETKTGRALASADPEALRWLRAWRRKLGKASVRVLPPRELARLSLDSRASPDLKWLENS